MKAPATILRTRAYRLARAIGERPSVEAWGRVWDARFDDAAEKLKRLAGGDAQLLRRTIGGPGDEDDVGRALLVTAALLAEGHRRVRWAR